MAKTTRQDPNRLFIKDGFRHYRRTYSTGEAKLGLAVLGALALVVLYVGWRKHNPADPNLFAEPPLTNAATEVVNRGAPPATGNPSYADTNGALGDGERGPVPPDLAADGWTEGAIRSFDADNLYVKINGRADYFLAKGFERLYFIPLARADSESLTVDIEMYDMGAARNALGTFSGERRADEKAESGPAGLTYFARNALYMARGRFYIRAIGSDESPAVKTELEHLRSVFDANADQGELPWAFDFFARLGVTADRVVYQGKNAFSFDFARDVYIARSDGDSELFAVALADDQAARALAEQFISGFASLGKRAGKSRGVPVVKDEFIGTFAGALAVERWVVGVKGAATRAQAGEAFAKLRKALADLPAEVRARAQPSPATDSGEQADSDEREDSTSVEDSAAAAEIEGEPGMGASKASSDEDLQ